MRRLAAALALAAACAAVLAVVLAGRGPERAASALDDALGYFGEHAPLVAAIDTDPDGRQGRALAKLLGRVPVGSLVLERLTRGLSVPGIDPQRDLRPQLGNPLVVGLERAPAGQKGAAAALVAAIRVKKPLEIKRLLLRDGRLLPRPSPSGRRIFEDRSRGGLAVAVDGRLLVAGGSRAAVAQALATRRSPGRMRERVFGRDLAGLPGGAGVRIVADPRALIAADARLAPALGVKWVAALRRAAATVQAEPDGLALALRIRTDAAALSSADLPLAPRAGPIALFGRPGELAVGVREPARLVRFGAALVRALEPKRAARAAAIARGRGVELGRDLTQWLGPTAALAVDPIAGSWAARVSLRDPGGFKLSLQRLGDSLPDVAAALGVPGLGVATPEAGEGFYALARPRGKTAIFGVIGSALVAAGEPRRAAGLASEPLRSAPERGALTATVDVGKLALRFLAPRLHGLAALGAPLALDGVGELSASLTIDRGGLRGTAKLTVAG